MTSAPPVFAFSFFLPLNKTPLLLLLDALFPPDPTLTLVSRHVGLDSVTRFARSGGILDRPGGFSAATFWAFGHGKGRDWCCRGPVQTQSAILKNELPYFPFTWLGAKDIPCGAVAFTILLRRFKISNPDAVFKYDKKTRPKALHGVFPFYHDTGKERTTQGGKVTDMPWACDRTTNRTVFLSLQS